MYPGSIKVGKHCSKPQRIPSSFLWFRRSVIGQKTALDYLNLSSCRYLPRGLKRIYRGQEDIRQLLDKLEQGKNNDTRWPQQYASFFFVGPQVKPGFTRCILLFKYTLVIELMIGNKRLQFSSAFEWFFKYGKVWGYLSQNHHYTKGFQLLHCSFYFLALKRQQAKFARFWGFCLSTVRP